MWPFKKSSRHQAYQRRAFATNGGRSYAGADRLSLKLWRPSSHLILFILVLVSISLLSYRFLVDTRIFMLEGQSQAQKQLARGVVTLFQDRADLLSDLPYLDSQNVVLSHPLKKIARVDGYVREWLDVESFASQFKDDEGIDGYSLLLGDRKDRIYGLVRVVDDKPVVNLQGDKLTQSDHLRLSLPDRFGNQRRLIIVPTDSPDMEAWYVEEDWITPKYSNPSSSFIIQAVRRSLVNGYLVEFALPRYFLNNRQEFGLAVVDVDSDDGVMRHLKTLVSPETNIASHYNLLAVSSPEAAKILASLDTANSQIIIYDTNLRVRASVGNIDAKEKIAQPPQQLIAKIQYWLDNILDWIVAIPVYLNRSEEAGQERQLVLEALNDKQFISSRWYRSPTEEIVGVSAPITDQENNLLGIVLIKQSTNNILNLQRQAVENIALASLLIMIAILLVLLGFSWRQAFRVRRLGYEASQIVDSVGRLQTNHINSDVRSNDELGDLARSFSEVVAKLHDHQQFMSTMPRTLRHEINNPLNATMTSLENMSRHGVDNDQSHYLEIANRGLLKISTLIEKLADATSLEESLQEDELEDINLSHLIGTYVNHQKRQITNGQGDDIVFECQDQSIMIKGVDYRIEQLLDKLLDNARDFKYDNTAIIVRLYNHGMHCMIEVENEGDHVSDDVKGNLFASMVSGRKNIQGQAHFGLGLYVARVISLYHSGDISVHNLGPSQRVMFRVRIPLYLNVMTT